MKKQIILLGASGSVGSQTVNVIDQHTDLFYIKGLSVGKNIAFLENYLSTHELQFACCEFEEDYHNLVSKYPKTKFFFSDEGLIELTSIDNVDLVFNCILGFAGLLPTINALRHHVDVAVANKESLVVAGDIVMNEARKNNVKVIPVDSEHSAIFQTLSGSDHKDISKLIITASGGAFKNYTREQLKTVTKYDALKHPKWHMGEKITIDSASMMNKGFEVIEAHVLFDIPYDKIETIIHPESVIHSMTEFVDHSVIAELGVADMRLPIQYALTFPRRVFNNSESLDLCKVSTLNFKPMDIERFPLVDLAYKVGKLGGNMLAVLNGANETIVEMFLEGKCSFLDIERINFAVCDLAKEIYIKKASLEDIIFSNDWAIKKVKELMRLKK